MTTPAPVGKKTLFSDPTYLQWVKEQAAQKVATGTSSFEQYAGGINGSGVSHNGNSYFFNTPRDSPASTLGLQVSDQQASDILNKNGLKISDLDPNAQKALKALTTADQQAAYLGQQRKKGMSWWQHGLDWLTRPMSAVEGTIEGLQTEHAARGQEKKGNFLSNLPGEWKAGLEEGWKGLTGENHHSGAGLIDRYAQIDEAKKENKPIRDVVAGTATLDKQPHVSGWFKYPVGFATDVLADPLTYTGVGKIAEGGLKGAELVSHLEQVGKAATELSSKGEDLNRIHQALQVKSLPVRNLSKEELSSLSPAARSIADAAAKAQVKLTKKDLSKLYKSAGESTAKLGAKLDNGKTVKDYLKAFEDGRTVGSKAPYKNVMAETLKVLGKDYPAFTGPAITKMLLEGGIKNVGDIKKLHWAAGGATEEKFFSDVAHALTAGKQAANIATSESKYLPYIVGKLAVEHPEEAAKLQEAIDKGAITNFNDLERYLTVREGAPWTETARLHMADATGNVRAGGSTKIPGMEGLTKLALKSASPDVFKKGYIRVGGAYVPAPGLVKSSELVSKGVNATKLGRVGVEKGSMLVDKFNNLFRAKAGIANSLHLYRNIAVGGVGQKINAYVHNLQQMAAHLTNEDRRSIMRAWRKDATEDNPHKFGVDLTTGQTDGKWVNFLSQQVNMLNELVATNKILPEELNKFWPYNANPLKHVGRNAEGQHIYSDTVHQNWLKDHLLREDTRISDPVKMLAHTYSAVTQVLAKRSMYESIADEFGFKVPHIVGERGAIKQVLSKRLKALKAEGYREVKGVPELRHQLFHPEIASGIERMAKVFDNQQTADGLLRSIERATSNIKAAFTIYNPGFTPRTIMGEALLNYIAGVPIHAMPQAYKDAARIMRSRDTTLFEDVAHQIKPRNYKDAGLTKRNVRSANLLQHGESSAHYASVGNPVFQTKFGKLTADEVWHHYLNSGVKSGFVSSDLSTTMAEKNLLPKAAQKVSGTVHNVSEFTEDLGRLAHFTYLLKTSKASSLEEAVRQASEQVLKYHLDYSAVTRFEKHVAANVIPFYKWIRLSTPLMADALLHNPGRMLAIPKTLSNASKAAGYDDGQNQGLFPGVADKILPDYISGHGAYPFGGGNTHYFDPTQLFPLAGSLDLAGPGIIDRLNPLITQPVVAAGRLGGAKTTLGYQTGQGSNKQSWADFLAQQTPQTKFANQEINPPDPNIDRLERLLMFLGNPGIVSNTPRKMQSQIYQDRDAALINRKIAKKNAGLQPTDKIIMPQDLLPKKTDLSKKKKLTPFKPRQATPVGK